MRAFEEALGRAVFATRALVLLRLFLSSMYAFACAGPGDEVRAVPPRYVSFILRFLAGAVEDERHRQCAAEIRQDALAPRADAQALDERSGVGGGLQVLGSSDRIDTNLSPWFSEELIEDVYPWVFQKEGKASRVEGSGNASLNTFLLPCNGTLGENQCQRGSFDHGQPRKRGAPQQTCDEQVSSVSSLLGFSEQLRDTGWRRDLRCAPREINLKADRLANGNFQEVPIGLRIPPLPQSPDWYILDDATIMGKEAEDYKRRHRTLAGAEGRQQKRGQRRRLEEKTPSHGPLETFPCAVPESHYSQCSCASMWLTWLFTCLDILSFSFVGSFLCVGGKLPRSSLGVHPVPPSSTFFTVFVLPCFKRVEEVPARTLLPVVALLVAVCHTLFAHRRRFRLARSFTIVDLRFGTGSPWFRGVPVTPVAAMPLLTSSLLHARSPDLPRKGG